MLPRTVACAILICLCLSAASSLAAETEQTDPYWILIHDQAIHAELKFTEQQRKAVRQALDELDLRFMALRGQSAEQIAEKLSEIRATAQARLKDVLRPEQHRRLSELTLRAIGTAALLRPDVAQRMKYTDDQRKRLEQIIGKAKEAQAELAKRVQSGKGGEAFAKERTRLQAEEQTQILELMSKQQQNQWRELVGADFDLSRTSSLALKAPELAITKDWLNSQPLQLAQLEGQVVVLHFYAFGCINCVRNYPHYRSWREKFAGRGVTLIGIHTPETSGERSVAAARQKAQEEKLVFPIVIDNDKANWNAWGNTMWPTVYLIDKRGYVRYWWMGELSWQGAEGDKLTRQRIEELLAE